MDPSPTDHCKSSPPRAESLRSRLAIRRLEDSGYFQRRWIIFFKSQRRWNILHELQSVGIYLKVLEYFRLGNGHVRWFRKLALTQKPITVDHLIFEDAFHLPVSMWPARVSAFAFLFVISIAPLEAQSPPGRPKVTGCRSYDKETVTCWWEAGSDGGLPTNYTVLYWTEKNRTERECPDYHTSGPYTCFFDKAHSSFWMYYYIYVKASNALGTNKSEPYPFEIVDVVQPYPPRNLTLLYKNETSSLPYLLVTWLPPEKTDVKMGWITLQYQVRLKEEKKHDWEEHLVDHQTKLKVFGLTPGENYMVQVRSKAESKLWSEWSEENYIKIPGGSRKRDMTLWISIAVLSAVICLTMIWTMAIKGCSFMSCICPPVPGPKIMGIDPQLFKSGKSEDLLSAFGCQGFPPTSDREDLLVEFLEVDDSKEHLISSPERNLQGNHIKVSPVDTDNDSGRGSCDSPFVPSEGSKDQRVPSQGFESAENSSHEPFETKAHWPQQKKNASYLDYSDNKSFNWSDGMTRDNPSLKSSYHNITDVCKLALGSMNVNTPANLMPNKENSQQKYFRTIETLGGEGLNKQTDFADLHSKGVDPDMLLLLANSKTSLMLPRPMDYVEVHKVNQNDALALIPKQKENRAQMDQYSVLAANREYSKVERLEGNNILVLMPSPEIQVSPSSGDAMKEFAQKLQQSQAAGFIRPAQNKGDIHSAGMGYLDPSSFMP